MKKTMFLLTLAIIISKVAYGQSIHDLGTDSAHFQMVWFGHISVWMRPLQKVWM
jgi:hypothetical protein